MTTLDEIPGRYWQPDPAVVSKLTKTYKDKRTGEERSYSLDYVGHADLTRTLIEIDPEWDWEPLAYDDNGLPRVIMTEKEWVLWGKLTLLGKTRICVGNCDADKHDAEKELIGDLLRNGAMRFGIFGGLWSKAGDAPAESRGPTQPARAASSVQRGSGTTTNSGHPTENMRKMIFAISRKLFHSPVEEMGFIRHVTGREGIAAEAAEQLSYDEGKKLCDALKSAEGGTWPKGWSPLGPGEEPF